MDCWQWLEWSCCQSNFEKEINQKIEKTILSDKRKSRRELKLLLLGTGESGKSTFIKQMKIIHERDYTVDERRAYINVIHQNVFTAIHAILRAMDVLKIEFGSELSQQFCQLILESDINSTDLSDTQIVNAIKYLWADNAIQVIKV